MRFKKIVIAAGKPPPHSFIKQLLRGAPDVITVDGGAAVARTLRIKPALHVGDSDSYPTHLVKLIRPRKRIQLSKRKCESDLEHALNYIKARREVLVIAAHQDHEGRADHAFANLMIAAVRPVFLADEKMWITRVQNEAIGFSVPRRTVFSVLPVRESFVTVTGAHYNVRRKKLACVTMGLSNRTKSEVVTVQVDGLALLFVASSIATAQVDVFSTKS